MFKTAYGIDTTINKLILKLKQLCTPLRILLSVENKFHFTWDEVHEKAFKNILEAVHNITENRHFVSGLETWVVCDANRDNLGCALDQETSDGWATIAYASRFLNSCESKYSVNELELLAAVWTIEHFNYYLQFMVPRNRSDMIKREKEKFPGD